MRSIWKGSISFGLVSIGVKLYTATEERDVSFHQVRRSDGSRIRYKRVAEADGEEVAYADIAKGYQLPSGETVVLTDEDFADLPLPTARVVDVLQFVPVEQIDPIYFAKSYYLEPEKNAIKPYLLLRDALDSSGQAGLVKVAIRNREQLATLRVRDGVIVMETMIWPDEVREPAFGFLDSDVDVRPQERQMAESLVASMSGDFDPSEYTDDYREALQGGHRRQDRGPRDRRDRGGAAQRRQRRRPDVGAEGLGRGGQGRPAAAASKTASGTATSARVPAKKSGGEEERRRRRRRRKKAPAKKTAPGEEDRRCQEARRPRRLGQEGRGEEARRPRRRLRRNRRDDSDRVASIGCAEAALTARRRPHACPTSPLASLDGVTTWPGRAVDVGGQEVFVRATPSRPRRCRAGAVRPRPRRGVDQLDRLRRAAARPSWPSRRSTCRASAARGRRATTTTRSARRRAPSSPTSSSPGAGRCTWSATRWAVRSRCSWRPRVPI